MRVRLRSVRGRRSSCDCCAGGARRRGPRKSALTDAHASTASAAATTSAIAAAVHAAACHILRSLLACADMLGPPQLVMPRLCPPPCLALL